MCGNIQPSETQKQFYQQSAPSAAIIDHKLCFNATELIYAYLQENHLT